MFKVNNKNTRMTPMTSMYFKPFSLVSIVDFEQINVSRVDLKMGKYEIEWE